MRNASDLQDVLFDKLLIQSVSYQKRRRFHNSNLRRKSPSNYRAGESLLCWEQSGQRESLSAWGILLAIRRLLRMTVARFKCVNKFSPK
jgi:hypothetical protein